jgi:carbon-monoxide dehydrogenase large subunit
MTYIGRRLPRDEDLALLTGRGHYVSDTRLPGMAQLAFVRSPHAHARIRSLAVERARALPGVIGVYTADDLAAVMRPAPGMIWTPGGRLATPTPLARAVVRYVGEPVAVVCAENRYLAEDAADAVTVAYEPLPFVLSVVQDATTPILHDGWPSNVAEQITVTVGAGAQGLAGAAVVADVTLRIGRVSSQPLEPRAVAAVYDGVSDLLTVYHATQAVHTARSGLAATLGIPEARIRVIAPDVGGAFGTKNRQYPEEVLVAHLALMLRRPVKWVGDRREEFISTNQGRDQLHHAQLGLDADGHIMALVDHFFVNAGAYNPTATVPAHNTVMSLPGPYRVPHLAAGCDVVLTNTMPTGPYRGAGRPEANYVMERCLDAAADLLGIDRVEVRRRNLIRPYDLPYTVGLNGLGGIPLRHENGDYPAGLTQTLAAIDYDGFRARQAQARSQGRNLGIGVANGVEIAGTGQPETASIRIAPDGEVTVVVGTTTQGQGHHTTLRQIVADRLGAPFERINVVEGDTAAIASGVGSFASRSTTAVGNAASLAAQSLRRRLFQDAAARLEANIDDLVWEGDTVRVHGVPKSAISSTQIVAEASESYEAERTYTPASTIGYLGQAVVVEVDPATCQIAILDYVICHDGGVVVNPLLADGQDIGAAVQGLGTALLEAMRYDERGAPLTTTLQSYLLPSSAETPEYRLTRQEFPAGANPEGFKGLAEGGAIPAMAVLTQAVEDALAPFGARLHTIPLTPDALAVALQEAMSNHESYPDSYPPGARGDASGMGGRHALDGTPNPAPNTTLHAAHSASQGEEAQP